MVKCRIFVHVRTEYINIIYKVAWLVGLYRSVVTTWLQIVKCLYSDRKLAIDEVDKKKVNEAECL
jgi:hypothetical protein